MFLEFTLTQQNVLEYFEQPPGSGEQNFKKMPKLQQETAVLKTWSTRCLASEKGECQGDEGVWRKKKRREREYERRGRGLERMESGKWLGPLHGASSV